MRRVLVFSLMLLLVSTLLLPAAGVHFSQHALASETESVIKTYKDIPGVTDAEIEIIDALLARNSKFVYGMNETSEAFRFANGSYGGFAVLFAKRLEQLFGVPFEIEIAGWEDLVRKMDRGEIHFTTELTPTPERLDRYIMSQPILARFVKVFQNRNSDNLKIIAQARKLRLGFLNGATTQARVLETMTDPYEVIPIENYDQAMSMLFDGQIDAFFDENTAEAAFEKYAFIRHEDYFPILYSSVSFATADPRLAAMVSVLDKYLNIKGTSEEISRLYNQGKHDYMRHKVRSKLSRDEEAYIALHSFTNNAVKLIAEHENYPVSFYNQQDKEFQGIAIDVINQISDMTGLKFQTVNKTDALWPDMLAMLEDGRADMISELLYRPEREGKFLWGEPYATDHYALISLVDEPNIEMNEMLSAQIGMIEGTGFEATFAQWFPENKNSVFFQNSEQAFAALERGEVDYVMATQKLLLSLTNYLENPSFKANLVFKSSYDSMFGFNKDQTVLRSIIGKVQSVLDTATIAENWTRKTFDYRSKLVEARMPYMIGLAVLLLGGFLFATVLLAKNRRMSRHLEEIVERRTEQLELRTEEAQEANRTKSDFLARMSHEIRTPLNAIIGMTQVARRDVEDPEKAAKSLNKIQAASAHLLDILNDVLDMSKIEAGKFEIENEPFSLDSAMREVASIIKQRCNDRDVQFETNAKQLREVSVIGDRMRLKQVLINLLGNAVKFTNPGGSVRFQTEVFDESENRERILFTVSDTGIGMTQKQMRKLFMAFEQADNTIAGRFGGTGLGLVISQNLVKMMGGEIKVRSRAGEGSTFFFELTLEASDYREQTEIESELRNLDLSGKRILLVEDVLVNRLVVTELLSDTHVAIEEAEDGQAALEIFGDSPINHYDLVFMDVQMPRLNGYQSTMAIRALDRPDAKTVPILAMTANAYKEDIERAIEAGMNGHLAKPIDIGQVKRTLREYLGSSFDETE